MGGSGGGVAGPINWYRWVEEANPPPKQAGRRAAGVGGGVWGTSQAHVFLEACPASATDWRAPTRDTAWAMSKENVGVVQAAADAFASRRG